MTHGGDMKYTVCMGNIIDGFYFVGPFVELEDAIEYMDKELSKENMCIIELNPPAET